MKLEDVSKSQLRNLASRIGLFWREPNLFMEGSGNHPTPEQFKELNALTTRYKKARKAFDAGKFLEAIEIATEPAEAKP